MADLQHRVNDLIQAARDKSANPNDRFTAQQDINAALIAWLQGIEDALSEIALEVEKLSAAVQREAPADND